MDTIKRIRMLEKLAIVVAEAAARLLALAKEAGVRPTARPARGPARRCKPVRREPPARKEVQDKPRPKSPAKKQRKGSPHKGPMRRRGSTYGPEDAAADE